MKHFLAVCVLFLLAAPAPAQVQPGPLLDPERVYMDEPGDGHVWARTESYKASFGAEGATFIPFLGSKAPHNYPLGFHVIGCEAIAAPSRSQVGGVERIEFDHGSVIERYDLAPGSMEQSFVLRERPAAGDFTLRIGIETELEGRLEGGEILFTNELGGVRYGRATAIDAQGRRTEVPALLHEGEIELVVPAAFLAEAEAPITIDPVVSSFSLAISGIQDQRPDVAYDLTTDHYIVVMELEFSATDHDVLARIISSSGTWLWALFIDSSATDWRYPSVANNAVADQFMTVAQVGATGFESVYARTATASNGTQGSAFQVSGTETGQKLAPVIGGDPNPSGANYYCIVWENLTSNGTGDIHYQLVRPDQSKLFATTQTLDGSTGDDIYPSISKSDGNPPTATQEWNVAWTRVTPSFDFNIHAAQIHRDGLITSPSFGVSTSATTVDYYPYPSSLDDQPSGPRNWMIAWTRDVPTSQTDTYAAGFNGSTYIIAQTNLSGLEDAAGSGTLSLKQELRGVECDGSKFVIAYSERNSSGSSCAQYVASFDRLGTDFRVFEAHVQLPLPAATDGHPRGIVAQHSSGGPRRRCLIASDVVTSVSDVYGTLYDAPLYLEFCNPGFDTIACPCGNTPSGTGRGCNNSAGTGGAMIAASGSTELDTVVLGAAGMLPTATCIFLQGSLMNPSGVGFGDGVRCAAGTLKRLYVKTASSGFATAPGAGDPSIKTRSAALGDSLGVGSQRAYQVYYRDPQTFGCAAPATFNITPALLVEW